MKVRIRMANELFYDETDIEQEDFVVDKVFEDEVFGWWRKCAYISIMKEDYDGFLVKKIKYNKD
jgi:hypothetical protein